METLDKAVSTEDFTTEPPTRNVYVEAAKLEAILNALVDHKVESMKNEKTNRVLGSPKQLITRLRITSTSSSSLKDNRDNSDNSSSKRLKYSPAKGSKGQRDEAKEARKCGPRKCRLSNYSALKTNNKPKDNGTEDDRQQEDVDEFLAYDAHFLEKCVSSPSVDCDRRCCCSTEEQQQQKKDYVSLKIEDLEDDDESEVLRRMRRKRRRRRKKKLKRLAITTVPVVLDDQMKVIDPDELPQRARWTIVATACLLLFMCLLLVGVTLRMAPIIDDMVRKENEELMKSLNREPSSSQQGLHNTSTRTVLR